MGVAVILLLAAAVSCKKSAGDVVAPLTAEQQQQAETEAVRTFLVQKYHLDDKQVGFDRKNKYFNMFEINIISYEDALIEFQQIKK